MAEKTLNELKVHRYSQRITRDESRVITRPYIPGDVARSTLLVQRVLALPDQEVEQLLGGVLQQFSRRHKHLEQILDRHYQTISAYLPVINTQDNARRLLIGAYFTMEYAVEAAALFNPSIVPHPDQSGLPNGALRFILSLRATGEGHVSSIVFRSGVLQSNLELTLDAVSDFVETPTIQLNPHYDTNLFRAKLSEMNAPEQVSAELFSRLGSRFNYNTLLETLRRMREDHDSIELRNTCDLITQLTQANYEIFFRSGQEVSEKVIFPVSSQESGGIEDARFVLFFEENGQRRFYATYTAYNGYSILPQLIETDDFETFQVGTLYGDAVKNKGMALFPRKIHGHYAMLSRQDGVNNYIMMSNQLYHWSEARLIQEPAYSWELIQIGNCGSPLEINEGWLVLTHGVGPMRQYNLGAILLDKVQPERMLARLEIPLLTPNAKEREGYVPNVLYTCGALLHQNHLVIPYAMSDISTTVATVPLSDLLNCMRWFG